jgi:hypothetical protein
METLTWLAHLSTAASTSSSESTARRSFEMMSLTCLRFRVYGLGFRLEMM